jgi:hypothetical protein
MEEFRRLADCLKNLDLNHPERIDLPKGSDAHEAILRKVNELITDYKKQQVDMAILSQSFNEVQANLLESQKMAKVGSFVYDVKKESFSATTQIYRILGRKLGNKLKWKKFVECVDSEDRDDFLQKVESALCKGSKFYYRFGLSSSSGKTIDVEGRFKVRKKSSGSVKLIGTIMDISKQIEIEKTIEFLAFHDPLTGLGNRRLFNNRLTEAVNVAKRYDDLVGVLFIDVDRFKYINDTLGHNVGDRLIKEIAQILRKIVRESDTVARLGGDEFVIFCRDLRASKASKRWQKRLSKS